MTGLVRTLHNHLVQQWFYCLNMRQCTGRSWQPVILCHHINMYRWSMTVNLACHAYGQSKSKWHVCHRSGQMQYYLQSRLVYMCATWARDGASNLAYELVCDATLFGLLVDRFSQGRVDRAPSRIWRASGRGRCLHSLHISWDQFLLLMKLHSPILASK